MAEDRFSALPPFIPTPATPSTEQLMVSMQEMLRAQQAQLAEQQSQLRKQHAQHREQLALLAYGRVLEELVVGAPRPLGRAIAQFQKLGPPIFKGSDNPEDIYNFLRELEGVFRVAQCSEGEKMLLGPFQLKERAAEWWLGESSRLGTEVITWEDFKWRLESKFLPETVRERLRDQFLHLSQGSMSVIEYEEEFTRLSCFATSLVATERRKATHFPRGLNEDIQRQVVTHRYCTYTEVLEAALEIELLGSRLAQTRVGKKRVHPPANPSLGKRVQLQHMMAPGGGQRVCSFCSKFGHTFEECYARSGACYNYGRPGHQAAHCRVRVPGRFPPRAYKTPPQRPSLPAPPQFPRLPAPDGPHHGGAEPGQRAPFQPRG